MPVKPKRRLGEEYRMAGENTGENTGDNADN